MCFEIISTFQWIYPMTRKFPEIVNKTKNVESSSSKRLMHKLSVKMKRVALQPMFSLRDISLTLALLATGTNRVFNSFSTILCDVYQCPININLITVQILRCRTFSSLSDFPFSPRRSDPFL